MALGSVISALTFSGLSYLFLSPLSSDREKQESYQRDHNARIERRQEEIDAEQRRKRTAQRSENHLQELDASMREYAQALEEINPEPKFYQYYHPSEDRKKKDYIGRLVAIAAIGGVAYYVL